MKDSRIVINNNKMTIRLHRDEAESYLAVANEKSKKFERLNTPEKSPYGQNHPHSHYVGLVTEHAAWVLFTEIEHMLGIDLNIDPAFKDPTRESECDIYVAGKRIEVKGIKYGAWKNFGPCISTKQLPKIKKKADIVLWVLYNEKSQEMTFVGFNEVKDITSVQPIFTGKEGRPKIENYPVKDLIKELQELVFV